MHTPLLSAEFSKTNVFGLIREQFIRTPQNHGRIYLVRLFVVCLWCLVVLGFLFFLRFWACSVIWLLLLTVGWNRCAPACVACEYLLLTRMQLTSHRCVDSRPNRI